MGVKVSNNAFGTLSAGINTSDTTITLDSGQGARFPTLGAGDYFYGTVVDTSNNLEIVKVTARSSDSMTVVRGQDNTTATAFAIGDRFELRPTAALFEDIALEGELVNDTTPQLGGDLDLNSNDITGTGDIDLTGTIDSTGKIESAVGYKLDADWMAPVMGRAHHKFTTASSTTTSSSSIWNAASSSSFTYTKKKTTSLLKIVGIINCGLAYSSPSSTNHGYVDVRLKMSAPGRTTTYSGTSRAWSRVDTFTGIFEWTTTVPLEWISDSVFQGGDVVTVAVEYQFVQTAGSGPSRGGVNTWSGGSLIELYEHDWGH